MEGNNHAPGTGFANVGTGIGSILAGLGVGVGAVIGASQQNSRGYYNSPGYYQPQQNFTWLWVVLAAVVLYFLVFKKK